MKKLNKRALNTGIRPYDAILLWAAQNEYDTMEMDMMEMIISILRNQPDIPRLCIDGQPLDLVSFF